MRHNKKLFETDYLNGFVWLTDNSNFNYKMAYHSAHHLAHHSTNVHAITAKTATIALKHAIASKHAITSGKIMTSNTSIASGKSIMASKTSIMSNKTSTPMRRGSMFPLHVGSTSGGTDVHINQPSVSISGNPGQPAITSMSGGFGATNGPHSIDITGGSSFYGSQNIPGSNWGGVTYTYNF